MVAIFRQLLATILSFLVVSSSFPSDDFNARTTTYAYDSMNRLLSKTADPYFAQNSIGAAVVTYGYNAVGQRSVMIDASGTTSYSGYDNNGHATQISGPSGVRPSYTYDAAGNLTVFSGTNNVFYGYDALNCMSAVTFSARQGTNHTATYGYER